LVCILVFGRIFLYTEKASEISDRRKEKASGIEKPEKMISNLASTVWSYSNNIF